MVLALMLTGCTDTPSPDASPAGDIDHGRMGADSTADNGNAAITTHPEPDAGSDASSGPDSHDASSGPDSHDATAASLADADASSESAPGAAPTPVWRATSARVRLTQFSYWTGGSRFENARDALTKDQLAALEGIMLRAWDGECWEDRLVASLTVTDQDGSQVIYKTAGECDQAGGQVLDQPSLIVFLGTLPCLNASETRYAQTTPVNAPLLAANDGCEHGFFGSPPWLMLDVTKTDTPYTVRGLNCEHNQVELALYDELGQKPLAQGTAEDPPGCQTLRYSFSSAGKYALELRGVGGDYFLQVTHD